MEGNSYTQHTSGKPMNMGNEFTLLATDSRVPLKLAHVTPRTNRSTWQLSHKLPVTEQILSTKKRTTYAMVRSQADPAGTADKTLISLGLLLFTVGLNCSAQGLIYRYRFDTEVLIFLIYRVLIFLIYRLPMDISMDIL